MNELYAMIGFFVLVGLLIARMKREEHDHAPRAGRRSIPEVSPVKTLDQILQADSASSQSTECAKELHNCAMTARQTRLLV